MIERRGHRAAYSRAGAEHLDVIARMACGAQAHFRSPRVAGLSGPSHVMLYGSEATLRFEKGNL